VSTTVQGVRAIPRGVCPVCARTITCTPRLDGQGVLDTHRIAARHVGTKRRCSGTGLLVDLSWSASSRGTRVFIECNADECGATVDAPTRLDARELAEEKGWRLQRLAGGRTLDYCPTHAYRAEGL
jgi:hypothetical protein